MSNLISLGKASQQYQRDPSWIRGRLHSAGVEAAMKLNDIDHYHAADVQAAISHDPTKGFRMFTHSEPTINGTPVRVIEAALCRAGNLPNVEKQFTSETLEAASRLRGYGLQEMLLGAAKLGGYDTGRMTITDGNLRQVLKAAFSVHSITTMLSSLGSKFLEAGFNAAPQNWRNFAQIKQARDFKESTFFRLTTDLEYEKVGPGGEVHHGTAGQESYTVKADTYAKMLTLTRQDIINDDLGAFDDLRRRLGLGGALSMNRLFWTTWLEASEAGEFWTEARGNLATVGAGIDEDSIASAVRAFRMLASPDGGLLDLEPALLLCPPDLEPYALKWYNSAEIRDTTSDTNYATSNIWAKKFLPVSEPRLDHASFPGGSASTWWLGCKPEFLASATVATLDGRAEPIIESADANFDTLGIQLRGYHDFGVAMSEYRASVKCVVSE